ncbi:MAG: DUF4266 domain-containing protein [Thiohalomonadales bacterium]
MSFRLISAIFAVSIFLNACSTIQPWDRDLLAQKKMQLASHPLDSYLDDHIYYSKESSSGGSGVGGGGCGCN